MEERMTKPEIFEGIRKAAGLIKHVQISRNYGRHGGWLRCEFYTFANGDPTGITTSHIEYEFAL
jgi:hypothetical protein